MLPLEGPPRVPSRCSRAALHGFKARSTSANYAHLVSSVLRVVMGALIAALGFALLDAVLLVSIASAPSATADSFKATPLTQEYCTANYGRPLGEEFDWRGFTFQKYLGDAGCESHRQGTYLGTGVTVNADGDLVISARRHCTVDPVGEDSRVSESPCASKQTQYSVGRVRLAKFQVPSTDFEWGFDVRLPQRSTPGTRSALWLINLDQIYCDPSWGELDILEWYSSRPDQPEAATHATCTDKAAYTSWHHKPDIWAWGEGGRTGFHRWAVRKQTIGDKVTLRYLYDDRVYATHVCAERLPSSTCNAVLHRSWTAILQTAVFGDGSGPFTGPDPASSFPKQELVVRDMWVEPM